MQPLSPPPSASYWSTHYQQQQNIFNSPILNTQQQQPSIFTTPISPNQYQQTIYNYSTLQQQQTTTTPVPANETFEAKWARLQANKKQTNPFADDIAKKYEIKL